MRVRYEMYRNGIGVGVASECDLTEKKARKLFDDLKHNARCGWVELVAEDEDEGDYMKIIEAHDQISLARTISKLL